MIPHVTTHDEADITDLEPFRVQMNKELEKSGVKISMLPFMMKAAVATLKKFPEFNASLDGDALVLKNYWHIGFAADTPNGLMVPVIRDVDKKTVPDIAKEMGELAKLARDGKLKPDQMQGGTFTISSLGGIGGIYFTPIINAPEVSIMGVCKSYWKQHSSDGKNSTVAPHPAAVAVVGPPRDRRRRRGALQRPFRQRARRPAARAVLKGARSMANLVEVKVPDIGDFKDVAVIEVLVKPGEVIAVDTGADHGRVRQGLDGDSVEPCRNGQGDQGQARRQGQRRLGDPASSRRPAPRRRAASAGRRGRHRRSGSPRRACARDARAQPPASFAGKADIECEMLVLGAGPGGYSAAFRSADIGMKTVLVERYADARRRLPERRLHSVEGAAAHRRGHGRGEAARPTTASSTARPKSTSTRCAASRTAWSRSSPAAWPAWPRRARSRSSPASAASSIRTISKWSAAAAAKKVVKFAKAIIAAGSQAVKLPFMPDDERVVDSTGALLLKGIPKRMLVVGGGIIGLEMATVYSTLGTRIDVVEMLDGLMQGADRDLVKVWEKFNAPRFDKVMLKTKTVGAKATQGRHRGQLRGREGARQSRRSTTWCWWPSGRSPNGKKIGADKAGVAVTDRGFIDVDRQMRTNVPHIFAIGDIVGQPMLAHKAVHEAHVAAEAAHGEAAFFDARQIPSVAYTDPEVAWAGKTEEQCKAEGLKVGKAVFPWAASGRAIANGRDEGFTKLLFDEATHRVVGGGIVGTHAGDLIGEICLAVEMGCEPADIGKTIHPHPTLGESIGMAAEVFEGHCTDLPPQKKK